MFEVPQHRTKLFGGYRPLQKNDLAEAIKAEEDNVTAQRGEATQGPADNGEIVAPPRPPLSNSSPLFRELPA